jgi:hypothetical protein
MTFAKAPQNKQRQKPRGSRKTSSKNASPPGPTAPRPPYIVALNGPMVPNGTDLSHIVEPLRVFAVPIDTLNLDQANPNTHGDDQIEAIMATLVELGQDELLIFRPDGRVITHGNGRLIAARRLVEEGDARFKYMAAFAIEEDDASAAMRGVAHNALPRRSTFDHDVLAKITTAIVAAKRNVKATGLDDDAVQRLLDRLKNKPADKTPSALRQVRFSVSRKDFDRLGEFLKTFDDDRDTAFVTWLNQSMRKRQ